jgi:DNA mismatch repair protein MutS
MRQPVLNLQIGNTKVTPMMQQYISIKNEYPDYLLFYRMGDFYELFFDDAIDAAEILDIALTKRGKHLDQDIPMCGVPAHSADQYLEKLIRSGKQVAICEQTETPEEAKKRGGYKEVVRREVVRIVTSGTLFEDSLLDAKNTNYLACIATAGGKLACAWVDISTGEMKVASSTSTSLGSDISRINPKELLLPEKLYRDEKVAKALQNYDSLITPRANSMFDYGRTERHLKSFYQLGSLEGMGNLNDAQITAVGALLEYLIYTQKDNLPRLELPQKVENSFYMAIDPATRANLEILADTHGNVKNGLRHIIDKTLTAGGSRLFSTQLLAPLCDAQVINNRLGNVACFLKQYKLRKILRELFRSFPDMERATSRICAKRANPRDLDIVRQGLLVAARTAEILTQAHKVLTPEILKWHTNLSTTSNLLDVLTESISDEVPAFLKDGNFVRPGCSHKLDYLRRLKAEAHDRFTELKLDYIDLTGVNSLKLTRNNVLGYYVEVTKMHASKMPEDKFIHRQTLGNSMRYTTLEMQELETELLQCDDNIASVEREIFDILCEAIIKHAANLGLVSHSIAQLDVANSLAQIAEDNKWCRPEVDDSCTFEVTGGRHPVVERTIKEDFVPNDCHFDNEQTIRLITGPNMAGKSTYLRQNAIICILAQMGSFVPATAAKIGVVDKLFSRVGAGDNISQGQSTFMVEMIETANILNNATAKSFLILDEIGRGTSTHDGLAIAWSVVENIHSQLRSRTLFATHYHELTSLESKLERLRCYQVKVREWEDKIIFMHEVIEGAADKSYGIQVASLAGVPQAVIQRAQQILSALESKNDVDHEKISCNSKLQEAPASSSLLEETLGRVDVDDLTPRQAFDLIYELKSMVK